MKPQKLSFQPYCITSAFLLCLSILALMAIVLWNVYNPYIDVADIKSQFIETLLSEIRPKPKEKFIFLGLLLLIPIISYLSIKFTESAVKHVGEAFFIRSIQCIIGSLLITLLLFCIHPYSICMHCFSHNIFQFPAYFFKFPQNSVILFFFVAIFLYELKAKSTATLMPTRVRKYLRIMVIGIVFFAILLQSVSFRLFNAYNAVPEHNLEPVLYPVTQVYAGQTLLAQVSAQYGMYAEILNPLFDIIGLNIFKFTSIMAILQITALLALFAVLWKTVKNSFLILLCMLSLCLLTGFVWYLISTDIAVAYFQYYPIRLFFPAVAVFLFLKIIKNKFINLKGTFNIALFCSLALLWNLDSGLPVLGSFIIYLATFIIFPRRNFNRLQATKYIFFMISTVLGILILFYIYLSWKAAPTPIHLAWILKYQKIFYQSGFMMLPMPTHLHFWQIVCAIYLFGITGALFNWMKGQRVFVWEVIFFLSILGLGIFTYYTGRSHENVLVLAAWPVILILFILCDYTFRLARLKMISLIFLGIFVPIVIFGILLSANYICAIPKLYHYALKNWKLMAKKEETSFTRNLQFIKNNLAGEKNTVILSYQQAIFFGELGKGSTINSPGIFEIALKTDYQHVQKQLLAGVSKTIFFQLDQKHVFAQEYKNILNHYRVIAVSQDNMAYLERKS